MVQQVLEDATATGSAFGVNKEINTLVIQATTWNSATAALEVTADGGATWIELEYGTTDDDRAFTFEAAPGFEYRVAITGSPTGVNAWVA